MNRCPVSGCRHPAGHVCVMGDCPGRKPAHPPAGNMAPATMDVSHPVTGGFAQFKPKVTA